MKHRCTPPVLLVVLLALGGMPAIGQEVQFTALRQDSSLPVQVNADTLTVDQSANSAVFDGNVVATQGEMVIKAAMARVQNTPDNSGIDKIFFTGRVSIASPTEAAEADEAVYTVATGEVVMTGNVLLTQGQTVIAGQKMIYDLNKGTGKMQGRVQTTFVPGSGTKKTGTAP